MLQRLTLAGARIDMEDEHVRLMLPQAPAGALVMAQLADHHNLGRADFPHSPPMHFSLHARVQGLLAPHAAGFGFWNDPFGSPPALPQGCWFTFTPQGMIRPAAGRGEAGLEVATLAGSEAAEWHHYVIDWGEEATIFTVDGQARWQAPATPGPLGIALWLSNRAVSEAPGGGLALAQVAVREETWLEAKSLKFERR